MALTKQDTAQMATDSLQNAAYFRHPHHSRRSGVGIMERSVHFSVDIDPVALGRARASIRGGKIMMHTPSKSVSYKKRIRDEAALAMRKAGLTPATGTVFLTLDFYIPMPASWSRNNHFAMNGEFHTQAPDLDNLVKAICDACNGVRKSRGKPRSPGILWKDDAQVAYIEAQKMWAEKGSVIVSAEWSD